MRISLALAFDLELEVLGCFNRQRRRRGHLHGHLVDLRHVRHENSLGVVILILVNLLDLNYRPRLAVMLRLLKTQFKSNIH